MYSNSLPTVIQAGTTTEFCQRAYDNQGNELSFAGGYSAITFINNATTVYSAVTTATTSDQGYLIQLAPATTSGWTAGDYMMNIYVSNGTNTYPVNYGPVKVTANLFTSTGYDSRSSARQILDALNAAILGQATNNQLALSIAGRSISRMSLEELIKAKSQFEQFVSKEEASKDLVDGRASRNTVHIRFV